MDSSEAGSKRLKLESKADDAHGPVNSIRLVRGANLPFAIELRVLSFLALEVRRADDSVQGDV
jgi:hypothetical protein